MDNNYVHQLVVDNEIGLALTYIGSLGFDVTLLLSNYNQHHEKYLQGILDYTQYSQQVAIVKSAIVNMVQQKPFSFDKAMIVKTTVIIVASKNDIALSSAIKNFVESAGYMVTITEAVETSVGSNMLHHKLLYVITENYFNITTKWPVSLTSTLTNITTVLFDESLDNSAYIKRVSALNLNAHDLSDAIEDGIKTGFPVGALAGRLVETEQAKLNLDKDFNYLWNNPPIDCRNNLFLTSMPTVLEKIKK